ncbi:MAG: hypothetical protein WC976_05975 [Caldisericia bacterium]
MIRKVEAVVVTFEHEDTPSYTVALFFEKAEAQKLRRNIEADVDAATSILGLNETIKDVYVIDTPIHSSAENYISKYMGTGRKDTAGEHQAQGTQAWALVHRGR